MSDQTKEQELELECEKAMQRRTDSIMVVNFKVYSNQALWGDFDPLIKHMKTNPLMHGQCQILAKILNQKLSRVRIKLIHKDVHIRRKRAAIELAKKQNQQETQRNKIESIAEEMALPYRDDEPLYESYIETIKEDFCKEILPTGGNYHKFYLNRVKNISITEFESAIDDAYYGDLIPIRNYLWEHPLNLKESQDLANLLNSKKSQFRNTDETKEKFKITRTITQILVKCINSIKHEESEKPSPKTKKQVLQLAKNKTADNVHESIIQLGYRPLSRRTIYENYINDKVLDPNGDFHDYYLHLLEWSNKER